MQIFMNFSYPDLHAYQQLLLQFLRWLVQQLQLVALFVQKMTLKFQLLGAFKQTKNVCERASIYIYQQNNESIEPRRNADC